MSAPTLVRRVRAPFGEPAWDDSARRVVAHQRGSLRVLGGPGTGRTTLLVRAALRRLHDGDGRGDGGGAGRTDPERVLLSSCAS